MQNNTTYTVSYTINSITTTSSFTSNSAGVILISGLGSGGYSGVITDLNGCASVAQSATLADPTPPSVSQPIGKVSCGGGPVVGTTFVGTAGATFNWTNSNTAVGLGASGQSNISAFLVPNVATNQLATVTITPVKNGCIGATQSFTILVRANPNVNSVTPLSYCSTDAVSAIAFTSTPVGATFSWTNNNTATGLAASNTGTIAPFTAAAVATLQRSIITVVPTLSGCVGAPSAVVLDINPFVSAGTAVATPPVCLSGSGLTIIDLSSKLTGVTATGVWTDVSALTAGNRFSSVDATLDPNGLPVGIYTFRYTVAGVAPCPNDAEEVTIIIDMCCPPIICLPATIVRSN